MKLLQVSLGSGLGKTFGLFLLLLGLTTTTGMAAYQVGHIVTNDFTIQNRLRWTNDTGQVFTPSNTVLRLGDFDGKIVFFCFFDVW